MNHTINITLTDATGKQFTFDTVNQFLNFCKNQYDFWVNADSIIGESANIHQDYTKLNYLDRIIKTINSWDGQESSWDEKTFNNSFQQLNQQDIRHLSGNWLWHGHAFVQTWIELHKKSQATADSFISTVLKGDVRSIANSRDSMIGTIIGYEYLTQGENDITSRSKSEKKSLSNLRDELTEVNNNLIKEVDNCKEEIKTWSDSNKKKIERLYKVRQRLAERQFKNQSKKFKTELKSWEDNITKLENTYQDLLRLRKPAEYWERSAKKYRFQGVAISVLIVIFAFFGLDYFGQFFTSWLKGQEVKVQLNTLQGIIIFGTILAIYAFLIRIFSRLAFSSFHLMRDAEEREQLTYLYLSLSEETDVDLESRKIVLQALFSRSETGLLAQENGPTMPSINDALKFTSKNKS